MKRGSGQPVVENLSLGSHNCTRILQIQPTMVDSQKHTFKRNIIFIFFITFPIALLDKLPKCSNRLPESQHYKTRRANVHLTAKV